MKKIVLLLSAFAFSFASTAQQQPDSVVIRKLFHEALANPQAYQNLDYLSNQIGGRLSGSPQAAAAVEWSRQVMEDLGLDRVYLQEVMVPHWVRGEKEQARIVNSRQVGSVNVPVLALGGSVGTGKNGITAPVLEVQDFEDLEKLGKKKVKGKIVFFNRPMDPTHYHTFHAYSGAVDQRSKGAIEAAKLGAVGVLVRSMNLSLDDYPHTGAMRYDDEVTQIPAAAISTNGAEMLSRLLKNEQDLQVYLKMNCQTFPDVLSYNVIGEIAGTEKPEEVVVVGGHIDSWDVGDGAHDDGAGCVQSIEVLRLFKELGIKPKRTVRAVMFMNEENGVRGGQKYAEIAAQDKVKHIAALESDAGGFTPRSFGVNGTEAQLKAIKRWEPLLAPYGLLEIDKGYGGVDIGPLKPQGTALIGLEPDSQRYFDYHHASTDTFDKVNRRELALGSASMAALVYLLATYGL